MRIFRQDIIVSAPTSRVRNPAVCASWSHRTDGWLGGYGAAHIRSRSFQQFPPPCTFQPPLSPFTCAPLACLRRVPLSPSGRPAGRPNGLPPRRLAQYRDQRRDMAPAPTHLPVPFDKTHEHRSAHLFGPLSRHRFACIATKTAHFFKFCFTTIRTTFVLGSSIVECNPTSVFGCPIPVLSRLLPVSGSLIPVLGSPMPVLGSLTPV